MRNPGGQLYNASLKCQAYTMRNLRKKLLDQAIAAMIAAIEVYNKPDFKYRDESFAILAINAWELLIKARWLMDHGNRIDALYVYQNVNGRRRVKRNRSGTPMTYSIDYLAGKLYECRKLPKPVHQNLEILSDLRNSAVHFYYQKSDFVKKLHEVANATVKNFYALIKEWFDKDLSHLSIYLMPLAFLSLDEPAKAIILNSRPHQDLF